MKSKIETRGRKLLPRDKKKPPQATVKINDFILPFVKELKGKLKNNLVSEQTLKQLFYVLNGNNEQQVSVFKYADTVSIVEELQEKILRLEAERQISDTKLVEREEISLQLVLERDKEHLKVIHTNSKLESLKSSYRMLKSTHDELLHREYDCMAIKSNGERCSKPAKLDMNQNGLIIRVCLQHKNLAQNNKKPS